ncbi:MAG: hypothetical protein FGO69_09630 [Methanobacterium sp.]|nr:MAG: hypothetical protein FGO69_09630 [Methanobacterium sp.]
MIPNLVNGHLPVGCHECTLFEVKDHFVIKYPKSKSRNSRFLGFTKYTKYICDNVQSTRKQIIDGSFTTSKIDPCDVDFVIVINNYELTHHESIFLEREKMEERIRKEIYHNMKIDVKNGKTDINELYCCDAYFLYKRKSDDKLYGDYLKDKAYWKKKFGNTRRNNVTGRKTPKGVLILDLNSKIFEEKDDI